MATQPSGAILAVDIGSVHTRAVLIDLVEGVYRPVAFGETRTTSGFPHGDVSVGVMRAAQQLTRTTGRLLVRDDGSIITPEMTDLTGVETYLVTTSIGRPMRTIVIGVTRAMSLAAALRAAAGTYVQIADTITLEDERSEEDLLNAITSIRPDLLLIVGGTEGGAHETLLDMARRAALALQLIGDKKRRVVLYAGNSDLQPEIETLFSPHAVLLMADNVRPLPQREQTSTASAQIANAYDDVAEERGAGFEKVASGSALGIMATAQSYSLVARYLAQIDHAALALDVGSAVSTLSASIGERSATTIRSDVGLGHSARALLDATGIEAVRRWLPFVIEDDELIAYALNKTLRPGTLPENLRELYLEHALLRAGVSTLLETARPLWDENADAKSSAPLPVFQTIIGAGAVFANTGSPGMSALLMLDSLQPTGHCKLLLDGNALIPALGALARVRQEAFVQLLDEGGIIALGDCINVSGQPRAGRPALRVRITLADGQIVKQDVMGGSVWIYPLPLGVRALIDVRTVGTGITIQGKRKLRCEVIGGTAGIIFDARGRPLPLGTTPTERAAQLPVWYAEATGDPIRELPPAWLTAPPARKAMSADAEESAEAAPPSRRRRRAATAEQEARSRLAAARKTRQRFRESEPKAESAPSAPKSEPKGDVDELRDLFS